MFFVPFFYVEFWTYVEWACIFGCIVHGYHTDFDAIAMDELYTQQCMLNEIHQNLGWLWLWRNDKGGGKKQLKLKEYQKVQQNQQQYEREKKTEGKRIHCNRISFRPTVPYNVIYHFNGDDFKLTTIKKWLWVHSVPCSRPFESWNNENETECIPFIAFKTKRFLHSVRNTPPAINLCIHTHICDVRMNMMIKNDERDKI